MAVVEGDLTTVTELVVTEQPRGEQTMTDDLVALIELSLAVSLFVRWRQLALGNRAAQAHGHVAEERVSVDWTRRRLTRAGLGCHPPVADREVRGRSGVRGRRPAPTAGSVSVLQ